MDSKLWILDMMRRNGRRGRCNYRLTGTPVFFFFFFSFLLVLQHVSIIPFSFGSCVVSTVRDGRRVTKKCYRMMAPKSCSSSRNGVIKLIKSIVLQFLVLCCLTSVWRRPSLFSFFIGRASHKQRTGVSAATAYKEETKNFSASSWTSGSRSTTKQVQLAERKDTEHAGLPVHAGSGFLREFVRKIHQLWSSLGRSLLDFVLSRNRVHHAEEDRLFLQDGGSNGSDNPPSKAGHVMVNKADPKGTQNVLNDIPIAWNGVTVTEKEKQMLHTMHEKRLALIANNCKTKTSKTCKKTQTGHSSSSWLETASSTEFLRFLRHKHGDYLMTI